MKSSEAFIINDVSFIAGKNNKVYCGKLYQMFLESEEIY